MKKNFMMTAAMAAVLVSSCSKNEQIAALPQDAASGLVGLDIVTGVTKTDATDLKGGGVTVYYDGCTDPISFSHTDANGWVQTNNPQVTWGSILTDAAPTRTLYSMHSGAASVVLAEVEDATPSAFAATVTQASDVLPTETKDYVVYAEEISAIPAGGDIQAKFLHATSKVSLALNFSAAYQSSENGTTAKAYVPMAKVMKFGAGDATVTLTAGNNVSWSGDFESSKNSAFPYLTFAKDGVSEVLHEGALGESGYLFPQTVSLTTTDKGVVTNFDEGHIEVLYRFEDKEGNSIVGFKSIQEYKDAGYTLPDGVNHDGPLYVKVGYVFTAQQIFNSNKQYTLNLAMPGGYVIGGNFVDEGGNNTDIPVVNPQVPGGPEVGPGEPVVPSPDQVIGLNVTVSEWPTPEPSTDLK